MRIKRAVLSTSVCVLLRFYVYDVEKSEIDFLVPCGLIPPPSFSMLRNDKIFVFTKKKSEKKIQLINRKKWCWGASLPDQRGDDDDDDGGGGGGGGVSERCRRRRCREEGEEEDTVATRTTTTRAEPSS